MTRSGYFCALLLATTFVGPAGAATLVTVYRDYDGDGTRDAGEPGIVGATATAYSATGATVSGTTGNDGTVTLATADGQHRVEVSAPGILRMGAAGSSGVRSDVQFGTDPAGTGNLSLSFAASNPAQYCSAPANADLMAVRNVREQLAGTTAQVSVSSWDYLTDSTTAVGAQTTWAVDQSSASPAVVGTGAQWGLAYRRRGDVAFSGAFVRTASPLGGSLAEESTGNIYAHTRSAAGVITTTRFLDLNAAAFGLIDLGPNPHSRSVVSNFDTLPLVGRDVVGKVGLGDIDISEDESTLYAVNLFQKELLVIPVGTAQAPSAPTTETQIGRVPIPRPANCANANDFRPFAIGIHDGAVYVGAVCTAQSVAPTSDPFDATRRAAMRAYVLQLNAAGTGFISTPVMDFQLNYPRRFANDGAAFSDSGRWLPWTDNPAYPGTGHGSSTFYTYPQAILSDLAFDGFGFLTLAFTDRLTLQAFDSPPGDGAGQEDTRYSGEMLLACENGSGGFNLESNGSCTARGVTRTAEDPNNDGLGTGTGIGSQDDNRASGPGTTRGGVEFYFGERYNYTLTTPTSQSAMSSPDYHRESATGALAILGGQGSVVTTVYDVGGTFNNGTRVMNNGNLARTNTGLMYRTGGYMPAPDSPTLNDQFHEFRLVEGNISFGKGNGLGDIEVVCETAQPIEIGNRVWIDRDADGVQDPDESGLAGITVQLRNSAGSQLGQTTTDANGNYLFILTEIVGTETDSSTADANVILPFASLYSQTVSISIPGTTSAGLGSGGAGNVPASYRLTTINANSGTGSDNRDSEGTILNSPAVPSARVGASLTVPASAGASTYTVDFGFTPPDLGDLPDTGAGTGPGNYQTRLSDNGPQHDLVAGNFIGSVAPDREDDGQPTAGANGDDLAGTPDDEDFSVPNLAAGSTSYNVFNIPVTASASTSLCGYLDANGDGDFGDTGETASVAVASGSSTVTLAFSGFPAVFSQVYLRLRLIASSETCAGIGPNGLSLSGEVEDHAVTISSDFGDLPNPTAGVGAGDYSAAVLAANNGDNAALRIGTTVDAEAAAAASATANGDDLATTDDEDATPGSTYALSATALTHNFRVPLSNGTGLAATFCGFLDANGDGDFGDAGEVFGVDVPAGTTDVFPSFTFAAPLSGSANFLRWRLSPGSFTCTAASAEGTFAIGEIEDYRVTTGTLDFGDLPDSGVGTGAGNYQTQLSDNGASHVVTANLRIGADVDAESNGQQTANADGDDLNGTDDETAGPYFFLQGTFSVPVFNNTGSATRLCGFIDLNGDGDFDDTAERASVAVPTSASTQNLALTFSGANMSVPSSYLRLRLIAASESCAASGPSSGLSIGPQGPSLAGEVEDHTVVALDFGDLPDTGAGSGAGNYQTTLADGGAHNALAPTTLRLGSSVDSEPEGQAGTGALGDNNTGASDEDGVTFPVLRQGVAPTVSVSVLNNTGATRNLCGYLDFNNNGVFDSPAEVVTTTVPSSASPQSVNLAFSGLIAANQTYANNNLYGRFRVQENACSPGGYGGAGEVEDYALPVSEVGVVIGAIPSFCPGQSVTFTITLNNEASRATATAFPVTADLLGTDDAGLAGSPSFADANWAVTSTTGGATLATSTGNGVDINTTATMPAGSSIVITVQATVANGISLARTVAADVRPAIGSADALASDDNAAGSSTLGSCGGSSGASLCPVTTGLTALNVDTADTVVNGYWAGAAAVTPGATVGRCVRVTSVAPAAGAATAIAAGDVLLLVQVQGATIDASDTSSYGDGVANTPGGATAAAAGTHEYVIAQGPVQATGTGLCAGQANVIEISGAGTGGGVLNSYTQNLNPAGGGRATFQVVRMPRYSSITFSGTGSLTASAWNGLVGGVVAVDVTGTVDLGVETATRVNVSGQGFRGAICEPHSGTSTSDTTLFRLPSPSTTNARKGEGYAGSSCALANVPACATLQGYPNGDDGKGAPGNAGGGGQHCVALWATGGGGGAGGGAGGRGGTAGAIGCGSANLTGHGGGVLPGVNSSAARLLMGGGGGAGARQSGTTQSPGGPGGGIIVIRANAITNANGTATLSANGGVGLPRTGVSAVAGGGGGGGGTVVLLTNLAGGTSYANTAVTANGGAGGNVAVFADPVNNDGSGGGGGGGRIFVAATAATPSGTRTATGGAFGTGGNAGLIGSEGFVTPGVDPVNVSPGVKPGFVCDGSSTVPVTIAQVESRNLGSELEVRFVTASEAGTLGYHVYADGEAGRTRLSRELVLATSDRGLEKQEYVVRGPQLGATSVTIEEVDVTGKSTFYGPYPLNRSVGERDFTQATDWGAIRSELAAWQAARVSALRGQGAAVAELGVSADGWYRVTGAELQAAGVDLMGVPVAELGLFVGGIPVPMQVEGGATVTPMTAFGFHGRAVQDSLYTTQQVYRLMRQAGPRLTLPPAATGTDSVARYLHVERQAPQRLYSFSSPLPDPWYASRIVRQGTTSPTTSFTVPVSAVERGEAEVRVTLYGGTDLPGSDDHHAVLRVNGQVVASAVFDGFTAQVLRATLDTALLTPNTTLEVGFGETPYSVDALHIESVELHYPRRLELLDGELRMAAVTASGGDQLLKSGFETADVGCGAVCSATQYVVGGVNPGQPVQVLRLEPNGAVALVGLTRDGSNVRFAAAGGEGVELLVTQRVRSANVQAGRAAPADLLSGSAKLLVIAHPSFIEAPQSELNRLLLARQAEGLSTKVVDVQDLYRAYSGGVIDPQAIAAYVRDAVTALGTRYVLLVGGDTYDYGNHLNLGSVSFVPTLYTPTSPIIRFAPADGMLADLDGDRRANVAVGRLPVRTVAELNRMVDRILSPAAGTTALMVSDREQAGYRYSEQNDLVASGLPAHWTQTHLKLDEVPVGQAATLRQQLVAALGQGQSLLSWYGHSSPSTWSREGLLTAPQVYGGLLTNASPTTVVQWGCWGAYFVDPRYNTLAHAFLLNASGGAASFIGATALTETVSDTALGERLKPLLAEPVRIGDALLEATLALPPGPFDDVTVGTVILGDPSARIRR